MTIDVYMTDFGEVRMGKYAKSLPRRKDGDFDKRYAEVRRFLVALNAAAADRYMSSRTAFLREFGQTRP